MGKINGILKHAGKVRKFVFRQSLEIPKHTYLGKNWFACTFSKFYVYKKICIKIPNLFNCPLWFFLRRAKVDWETYTIALQTGVNAFSNLHFNFHQSMKLGTLALDKVGCQWHLVLAVSIHPGNPSFMEKSQFHYIHFFHDSKDWKMSC